jgi:hypothetical protein
MSSLIYAISTSLDGYIADENGNFDWGNPSEESSHVRDDEGLGHI